MQEKSGFFSRQQWVILAATFVLLGLFSGFNFLFGIFLDPLIHEFGWARSTASFAYSINMFMIGASAMVAGSLADRYGTRPVVLVGSFLGGLSLLFSSGIHSLWSYYLLAGVLAGIGRSCFLTPVQAFIQRIFTRNRGLATGLAGSGTGMGVLLLSPLAGYLITVSGWRLSYFYLGSLFLVVALPVTWLLRPTAEATAQAPAPAASRPETEPLPEASQGMRTILRRRPFWAIFGSHTFDCVCHSVLIVHLVPIAIEAGISRVQAASLMGVMGMGAFLGRILLGALADRVGSKHALLTTLLLQTLPVPLLLLAQTTPVFYLVAAMVGLGLGGHGTMYPVVTREYYGPKRVGLLYGAFSTGSSTGMATGGFMGGLLYDLSGDYTLSILFSFVMGVLSVAMVLLYPGRRLRLADGTPARESQTLAQPTV